MNKLRRNLGLIYFILPYIEPVKNKLELVLAILFGNKNYKIKLSDGTIIRFKYEEFNSMLNLLGVLSFAISYSIDSKKILDVSFDPNSRFSIPLDSLSYEDQNLLELLFEGTKYGANFIVNEIKVENFRDKTFKILIHNNKKIVETADGVKFYIDSIHPGNTIVETFVREIHLINSHDDWKDKVIIDVGAECGDTPLYYAKKGAIVYAFEPIKDHYDAMIRNLELNSELAKRVIPINAAIGKDGKLSFFQSNIGKVGGTSFVSNIHGKDAKITNALGYSLESAIEKFNIENIELLKMDCKGCEFFLTESVLKKINKVKIEYTQFEKSHKLEDLVKKLENAGFEFMMYKHDPTSHKSNNLITTIYGKRIQI